MINAVNYIDGIDGLALSQVLISFIYLSFLSEEHNTKIFIYLLTLPLFINLIFNFGVVRNYKFFSGNSGSLIIGFILSFLVIYLYKFENIHPAYLIWSLYFYVFEFLSVNIARLLDKRSLFKAGNDHLHHAVFFLLNKSHFKTSLALFIISIITIYMSILINSYFPKILSLVFLLFFLIYFILRRYIFTYQRI